MRKIIAPVFMSLDGVMQAPGGPDEDKSGGFAYGGWLVPHFDELLGASVGEVFAKPFDLLLGRRTYDIFASHWGVIAANPAGHEAGEVEMAQSFDRATKYVATHHPKTLGWKNSQALGNDLAASLRKLKADDGPELVVQGSSELLQQLLANDLVDELRPMVFPVVLGKGKRLFGESVKPGAFKLLSSSTSTTGVLITRYERAGELRTGSFALAQPSEAELARRAENV
jgi:dihydrofolate reductase